jgi:hypothetical protein
MNVKSLNFVSSSGSSYSFFTGKATGPPPLAWVSSKIYSVLDYDGCSVSRSSRNPLQNEFLYAVYNKTGTVRMSQARSCNHCCSGKAISIRYSECMLVALVNQHAMRMRSTVMCPVRLYNIFSALSPKQHDFRRKVILSIYLRSYDSCRRLPEP